MPLTSNIQRDSPSEQTVPIPANPLHTRNRVAAKEQVLQAWQQRRKERPIRARPEPQGNVRRQQQPQPTVCQIIQTTWQNALDEFFFRKQPADPSRNRTSISASFLANHPEELAPKNTVTARSQSTKHTSSSKTTFPSVVSILQANEIVKHVNNSNNNKRNTSYTNLQALSVLPQGYDWNQAILQMAQSRSRAFLLVDLAAMIRLLVDWKRTIGYHKRKQRIQLLYSVQSNAEPRLLRLLQDSEIVGLVVTTKWDIERVAAAALGGDDDKKDESTKQNKSDTLKNQSHYSVLDSCAVTGKPNGYLREFLRHYHQQQQQSVSGNESKPALLAVDGPQEVLRLHEFAKRLQRRQLQPEAYQVDYMVRLLPDEKSASSWKTTIQDIQQLLAKDISLGRIVGISVDCSSSTVESSSWTTSSTQLAVEALLDDLFSTDKKFDTSLSATLAPSLRIDLTGYSTNDFLEQSRVEWWNRLLERDHVDRITVDATLALVSPTGALCTRITGVRQMNDQNRHYYIDDGCYGGSLYCPDSATSDTTHLPLPLVSRCQRSEQMLGSDGCTQDSGSSKADMESDEAVVFSSTVWGPTCDGLDRVCRDIPLPKLERDDWLVFPNVGCGNNEGLGTAFNGFDPPDIVYCVLGYFPG